MAVAAYYLFLLVVALAVPLLHVYYVDYALEATRASTLLPAPFLLLKWLAQVGTQLAIVVGVSGVWLWFHPHRIFAVSVALTIVLLLYTTLYGCYAAVLLGAELNH